MIRAAALVAALCLPLCAAGAAPLRVVSTNLCTDQLAMLLAAPGQLVSVSGLAADPHSSAMAEAARAYPRNDARAEEIYLLAPDLVVSGSYTARETMQILEDLGIPVMRFSPATSLADVPARIAQMGAALHREAEAQAVIDEFNARLAALRAEAEAEIAASGAPRPRAALYYPNGYTTGSSTLAGDILEAAGFGNVAAEIGVAGGGFVPLEAMVIADPDALITSGPHPGASRAEELLIHPALTTLRGGAASATMSDRDWLCGTPAVLEAIAALGDTRRAVLNGAAQ
ncbi:ABC transporter substrate-binding protein [Celeribacter indicus]|uniref:Periplasmic binding protein n=1 Tax=Celeribacter indicus TaxID=1208324 RepID=A0A0B5E641_9RHOB|nr:ABC transporter substrate-binding protein [Celeribacter indicus]AJE47802.1 periplasmic binding protein [Celeribacter indicus]SDW23396.1 iron complex transport system substrate-binding protein [Celeribacter indicus]